MKLFGMIVALGVLIGVALFGSYLWDSYALTPKEGSPELVIEVTPGMSVDQIAHTLASEEIITSEFFFKLYTKFSHTSNSLQAGIYTLRPGMSFASVVKALSRASASEVRVTFPEGYTTAQMGATLRTSLTQISDEQWRAVIDHPGSLREGTELLAGIPSGQGLEGYLFPDTYQFRADANALTVAETMVLTLSRRFAENGIVVPAHLVMENGMTLHEVMTLASIVEREVQHPEDMAHVAGIFLTRLKIGMALQADATVNYITGKNDPGVSLEDSRIQSPYNTYANLGLPPGPISNPGMNAIKAVLHPIDSNDLYYLTDTDGTVHYAQTFEQHVQNKYRYLK